MWLWYFFDELNRAVLNIAEGDTRHNQIESMLFQRSR